MPDMGRFYPDAETLIVKRASTKTGSVREPTLYAMFIFFLDLPPA